MGSHEPHTLKGSRRQTHLFCIVHGKKETRIIYGDTRKFKDVLVIIASSSEKNSVYTENYPETLRILLEHMQVLPKVRNFSGVIVKYPSSFLSV